MKVKLFRSFTDGLNKQVDYIAKDKPKAARKFKQTVLSEVQKLGRSPFAYSRSGFYNRPDIRQMVIKGYKVVYKADEMQATVFVMTFLNMQEESGHDSQ